MKTSLKLEGLKELEVALSELPRATAKNVLRRTLINAGQVMADAESRFAPRGPTKRLSQSPVVTLKLTKRQRGKHVKVSPIEVFVGPTPHPKSVQTEFGNAHQAAQPHLRPAFDATKTKVAQSIRAELADQIDKAAQRMARKAARIAAKLKL